MSIYIALVEMCACYLFPLLLGFVVVVFLRVTVLTAGLTVCWNIRHSSIKHSLNMTTNSPHIN